MDGERSLFSGSSGENLFNLDLGFENNDRSIEKKKKKKKILSLFIFRILWGSASAEENLFDLLGDVGPADRALLEGFRAVEASYDMIAGQEQAISVLFEADGAKDARFHFLLGHFEARLRGRRRRVWHSER